MSIDQTDVVDAVAIDRKSGIVTLAIADHLDWVDEERHLLLLQEKINSYLRFLESGEIFESFPDSAGRDIVIDVVGQFDLCESAQRFLGEASKIIERAGFALRFRKLVGERGGN